MNEQSKPRILLLGAHGQVGWELRRSLRPLGDIIAAARNPAPGEAAVDLADYAVLRRLILEVRPALVVNAAAYALVDQAEKEPKLAQAVNGVAPGVIQETAVGIGAAVVHYSTDYVFDGSGTKSWSESDAAAPLSVYGRSKLAGEQAVQQAGGAALVLRTSWVYGIHGANFVKKILKLACRLEQLRVVDDQIGAPTSARFLADATAQMLAQGRGRWSELLRDRGGVYHVCCAGETSWYGFTQAIVERARNAGLELKMRQLEPIATAEFPTPARRPLNSRLSCRRLESDYGLFPPTWQEALDDSLPALLKFEFGV